MSIFEIMQNIYLKEKGEFISKLYKQLLKREPDEIGLQNHLNRLNSGVSKSKVFVAILTSKESIHLYRSYSENPDNTTPTIADKLNILFSYSNVRLVQSLYKELLLRYPNQKELRYNVNRLEKGIHPTLIAGRILLSKEFSTLLSSELQKRTRNKPAPIISTPKPSHHNSQEHLSADINIREDIRKTLLSYVNKIINPW